VKNVDRIVMTPRQWAEGLFWPVVGAVALFVALKVMT
jgi:hypothetical protein